MKTILISYVNRSGSTFQLNELSKFTIFGCLPEADQLVKLTLSSKINPARNLNKFITQLTKTRKDPKLAKAKLTTNFAFTTPKASDSKGDIFLQCLNDLTRHIWPEATIAVFKNTFCHHIYTKFFVNNPDVALILLTRDPRAIFYSQKNTQGSWSKPMSNSAIQTALEWNGFMDYKNKILKKHPARAIEVKFENLILNIDGETNRILALLNSSGHTSTTGIKGYSKLIPEELKKIHQNIDLEAQPTFISKWQEGLTKSEVEKIETLCRSRMADEGYTILHKQLTMRFILTQLQGIKWRLLLQIRKLQGVVIPPQKSL